MDRIEVVDPVEDLVISAFKESKGIYGALKIKKYLFKKEGIIISKRKVGKIMRKHNLISKYTIMQYKPTKTVVNK